MSSAFAWGGDGDNLRDVKVSSNCVNSGNLLFAVASVLPIAIAFVLTLGSDQLMVTVQRILN